MAASVPPTTRKFLQAVRRRLMLVRVAESIGVCCAIAAAAAVALIALLWWRGRSGMPAAAVLVLGVICGWVLGMARRPTLLAAAMEADRQLGLHDLLGTALLACTEDDAPASGWRQAVAAMAQEHCRRLRPSQIVLRRLGARAWSGIGLSAALVLTLGLLTSQPMETRAAIGAAANSQGSDSQSAEAADAFAVASPSASQMARLWGSAMPNEDSHRDFWQPSVDDSASASGGADRPNGPRGGSDRGAGLGLAVTPASMPPVGFIWSSGASEDSVAGQSGGGKGRADLRASKGPASGGTVAPVGADGRVRVWKSDDDSAGAGHGGIGGRQVPDWAADLVRDYFQRD